MTIQAMKPYIAGLFTIIGILILLKLGFWQVERLAWKTALIQSIETEYVKPINDYKITADNISQIYSDMAAYTVYRGVISGHFDQRGIIDGQLIKIAADNLSFRKASPRNGEPGYNLWHPIVIDGQKNAHLIIGWVHYKDKERVKNAFQSLDVEFENIPVTLKKPGKEQKRYPYIFEADFVEIWKDIAQGNAQKPVLRNKHKSYATFWFTMAFILLGFYTLYVMRAKKS